MLVLLAIYSRFLSERVIFCSEMKRKIDNKIQILEMKQD